MQAGARHADVVAMVGACNQPNPTSTAGNLNFDPRDPVSFLTLDPIEPQPQPQHAVSGHVTPGNDPPSPPRKLSLSFIFDK
ncbi:unnamed protein product [Gadus morhua 'NCC']